MKKNKLNILLIAIVAAIWIFVALKATGNLFTREDAAATTSESELSAETITKKMADEKLQLGYADPFLGTVSVTSPIKTENSQPIKTKKERSIKEKTVGTITPAVKFFGLVRNTGTNKMVAIVSVNNNEKRMAPGESFNEVTLEKITRDSILVSWNHSKIYIKK